MTVCGGLVVCGGSTRSSCCHTSPTTGGVSVSLGHMEVQNQIKLDIIVNCPLDRHHPDKTTFDNFELSSSTFYTVVNCPGVLHHLDEVNSCQLSTTCSWAKIPSVTDASAPRFHQCSPNHKYQQLSSFMAV